MSEKSDGIEGMNSEELRREFEALWQNLAPILRAKDKFWLVQAAMSDVPRSQRQIDECEARCEFVQQWVDRKSGLFFAEGDGPVWLRRIGAGVERDAAMEAVLGAISRDLGISIHNLLYVYRKYQPKEPEPEGSEYADSFFEALQRANDEKLITIKVLELARPEILGERLVNWCKANS